MKKFGKLYDKIYTFPNLLAAWYKARKGKRKTPAVAAFEANLEWELLRLSEELSAKTYRPGSYTTFKIYDPKERLISAAPFRDRVVHHALCNIIEPFFEKIFIYDSYANRKGKGTHRAIERYQYYARRYEYVLKCDIRKFFPSIDLQILKEEIRRKISCTGTLWLIDAIIDNSNPQENHIIWFPGDDLFTPQERRKGLPIGNLTSQFWANVYMNRFDHFVKEQLGVPGYIRYVDDFVLFSNNKDQLWQWKENVMQYLATLRLILHANKTHIHQVKKGVPFLGFHIFPHYRIVRKQNTKRHFRYIRKKTDQMQKGEISPDDLEASLNSWLGHVRFGQSERLEYRLFWYVRNQELELLIHPNNSWRLLEIKKSRPINRAAFKKNSSISKE